MKYEVVRLKACADGREAGDRRQWTNFHNQRRPQQAMDNQRPTVMRRGGLNDIDGRTELWVCRFAQTTQTRCPIPTVEAEKRR